MKHSSGIRTNTKGQEHKTKLANCRICKHFFDVILLDLSLPDRTGEPLIKDIVEYCAGVPVIVLTGYTDFDFGVKSLSLGISDYLLKDELTALSLYKSILYSIERQKHIREQLESEKRYSDLFNFSPIPMWVINAKTFKFLDVNEAAVNHYGYRRSELLRMTLNEIKVDTETNDKTAPLISQPGEITQHITVHQLKNGELRNVEVRSASITYSGEISNISIVTDITERLNYIKTIQDHNERLKEISWMQSHIIRAPLTRILGLVPLITAPESTNEDRDEMLRYLLISANELDTVIKDIVDKAIVNE